MTDNHYDYQYEYDYGVDLKYKYPSSIDFYIQASAVEILKLV